MKIVLKLPGIRLAFQQTDNNFSCPLKNYLPGVPENSRSSVSHFLGLPKETQKNSLTTRYL